MATLLNMERLVLIACILHMTLSASYAKDAIGRLFSLKKTTSSVATPAHENNRATLENIEILVKNIENIYTEFITTKELHQTGLVYNNVDSYLRFHKAYVKAKEENNVMRFSQFLQEYKVLHADFALDTMGYIMKLMDVIQKYPLIKGVLKDAYFITASPFDKDKIYPSDDYKDKGDKRPSYWTYEHVAGIIKFEIQSLNPPRVGYILLDPKYLIQPVVIMEDRKKVPFKHESIELLDDVDVDLSSSLGSISWFNRFLKKNHLTSHDAPEGNFIAGTYNVLKRNLLWPNGDDFTSYDPLISETVNIVYFFKKPYYTYVKNTVLPSLLLPDRTMKRFSVKNQMMAEMTVSGVESHNVGNISYSYYYDDNPVYGWAKGEYSESTILFDAYRGTPLQAFNDLSRLSSVLRLMEPPESRILEKKIVSYWRTLIQKFKKLNKEFLNGAKSAVENYIQKNKISTEWDLD